jgi:hypothetical protein
MSEEADRRQRTVITTVSVVGLVVGPLLMVDAWNTQDITGKVTPDEMVIGVVILVLAVLGMAKTLLARH